MTPEQFRLFCNYHNAKQIADAKVRHQEYLSERGPMPVTQTTRSSGSTNTRRGGGYGMGGFGGAGGYLGYGGGGGSGLGLGGFGGGGVGNNMSSSYSNTTSTTETTFPDMNDTGGGPVTVINPYCHGYWKQPGHFHLVSPALPAETGPSALGLGRRADRWDAISAATTLGHSPISHHHSKTPLPRSPPPPSREPLPATPIDRTDASRVVAMSPLVCVNAKTNNRGLSRSTLSQLLTFTHRFR